MQAATRGTTNQLVDLALRQLAELHVLTEVSGGPRGQLRWRAQEILNVLTSETCLRSGRLDEHRPLVASRPGPNL